MITKKILLTVVLIIFSVSLASPAIAQDEVEKPTCDFSTTFYSQYIWRGYELSKDSLVIFPSITVSYKGFGFNIWGDFDTNYEGDNTGNNDTEWWETDWVLTYSNSLCLTQNMNLDWTVGWIYYDVDGGDDEEVFVILGLDTLLAPSVSVWRGIEYGESWYINLSVSHSFPIYKEGWSLDIGGWAAYYDIDDADYDAWHDGNVWLGFTIPVNEWCSLAPSINYTFPLSDDAEDFFDAASFDGDDHDWVYGGVAVNISF